MAEAVHFLMVDDLDHNLTALEALLRRDDLVLHRARSGAEALEAMLHIDFALALLDVQMPGMDGYELAELMRGIERTRKIPIIFLTAAALDDRRRFRGYEAGAVDYIAKPIDPLILQSKAAVFFEIGRQAQELARQRDEMRSVSMNLTAALARLKAHADNSPLAVVELDADLVIREWSKGAERMFGWPSAKVLGRSVTECGWLTQETAGELEEWRTQLAAPVTASRGTLGIRATTAVGDAVDCECYGSVVPVGVGVSPTMSLQILDVTERRRAENTRSVLVGELNHRVKNMLANVQAIARQTARHAREPDQFAKTFGARLQALARAHSILSVETWAGAKLRDLIAEQMNLGTLSEDRVSLSGPDLLLSPGSALRMALTLHELTTNAVKYGALLVPEGRVTLDWHTDGDMLVFRWQEQGGPPVSVPERKGFGSTLILANAGTEGGEAVADWQTEGVVWTLRLSLEGAVEALPTPCLPSSVKAPTRGNLTDLRVLVIEDEALVSMAVVEEITDAGAIVAGTAHRVAEALEMVNGAEADVAILDGNLHGESVEAIAKALEARGIPFCFLSGYGREHLPSGFEPYPVVEKPFDTAQLLEALQGLAAKRQEVQPS